MRELDSARAFGARAASTGRSARMPSMSVTRIAWLVTVLIALVTGLLLLLSGYNGYAGLGLAVAIAAAINLL